MSTGYFHLKGIQVQDGQHVDAGVRIGTMGRTGNTRKDGDTRLHKPPTAPLKQMSGHMAQQTRERIQAEEQRRRQQQESAVAGMSI